MTSLKQITNNLGSSIVHVTCDQAIISIIYTDEIEFFEKHYNAMFPNGRKAQYVTAGCTTFIIPYDDYIKNVEHNWGMRVYVRNTYVMLVVAKISKYEFGNAINSIFFADGTRIGLLEADKIIENYDLVKDVLPSTLDVGWYPVG
jgi:hypothetical protein